MLKNRILKRKAVVGRLELEYYLLESEAKDCEDEELAGRKVYGIEILKKDALLPGHNNQEVQAINNFSCCRETTESVLEKLAEHTVTPVALHYVIEDML